MKNLKLSYLLILLFGVLAIQSCKKDPLPTNNQDFELGSAVQRNFMGVIKDQSNAAISNATVSIGSQTTTTDTKGVFILKNVTVQEKFAYIKVTKSGYLEGLKTVVPSPEICKVDLILLTESNSPLPTSKEIQLSNGTKVTFNGGFQDANGNPYTGTVNYSMNHIDPSSPTISKEMPGMLLGKTNSNAFEMLQTYGMLHVGLSDGSGNPLQIADGASAEIRMPIPSAMTNAPSTIPLWSFDENSGYWVEDGSANKIGNEYVGTVSHFSWWNCDLNFASTALCIHVKDDAGNPLANVQVDISYAGRIYQGQDMTNEYGIICAMVPADVVLSLTAYDNCGNTLLTDNFGPFTETSTGITEPTLTIPNNPYLHSVTGTFLDCSGNLITDGYVEFSYGGNQIIQYIENGEFSMSTLICNGSTDGFVEGIDYNYAQTSGLIPFIFSQPATDLGNIISCNTIDEYITYQVDNAPYFTTVQVSGDSNPLSGGFSITGQASNPSEEIYFNIQTTAVGNYVWGEFAAMLIISEIGLNTGGTNETIQFFLTNYGAPTEYIDVNFFGDYDDVNGITHSLTGSMHVRRAS